MATIEDHGYLKLCAELATCLSISIASARRQVEIAAAKAGIRDLPGRKGIVERFLKEARESLEKGEEAPSAKLDQLLEALAQDENFMVED